MMMSDRKMKESIGMGLYDRLVWDNYTFQFVWSNLLFKKPCKDMTAIIENPRAFQYIKKTKQTPEICLVAVTKYGRNLEHVMNQTPEICLAAVNVDGSALRFVEKQTSEICLAAVKQNAVSIQHVREPTPEIYLAAIDRDWRALLVYMRENLEEVSLKVNGPFQGYVWEREFLNYVKCKGPHFSTILTPLI